VERDADVVAGVGTRPVSGSLRTATPHSRSDSRLVLSGLNASVRIRGVEYSTTIDRLLLSSTTRDRRSNETAARYFPSGLNASDRRRLPRSRS
jgi:hypothetical protein